MIIFHFMFHAIINCNILGVEAGGGNADSPSSSSVTSGGSSRLSSSGSDASTTTSKRSIIIIFIHLVFSGDESTKSVEEVSGGELSRDHRRSEVETGIGGDNCCDNITLFVLMI